MTTITKKTTLLKQLKRIAISALAAKMDQVSGITNVTFQIENADGVTGYTPGSPSCQFEGTIYVNGSPREETFVYDSSTKTASWEHNMLNLGNAIEIKLVADPTKTDFDPDPVTASTTVVAA